MNVNEPGIALQQLSPAHSPSYEPRLEVLLSGNILQPYLADEALSETSRSLRESFLQPEPLPERLACIAVQRLGFADCMVAEKSRRLQRSSHETRASLSDCLDLLVQSQRFNLTNSLAEVDQRFFLKDLRVRTLACLISVSHGLSADGAKQHIAGRHPLESPTAEQLRRRLRQRRTSRLLATPLMVAAVFCLVYAGINMRMTANPDSQQQRDWLKTKAQLLSLGGLTFACVAGFLYGVELVRTPSIPDIRKELLEDEVKTDLWTLAAAISDNERSSRGL